MTNNLSRREFLDTVITTKSPEAERRYLFAAALRVDGKTFSEIAAIFGVSITRARYLVEKGRVTSRRFAAAVRNYDER